MANGAIRAVGFKGPHELCSILTRQIMSREYIREATADTNLVQTIVDHLLREGKVDLDQAWMMLVGSSVVSDDPVSRMRWIAERKGSRS